MGADDVVGATGEPYQFAGLVLDAEAAVAWREAQRDAGRRVVSTNGVFDLLHAGHVAYLAWSRAQGDALIVLLNEDATVRALKGPERPIVPFADIAVLLLIRCGRRHESFAQIAVRDRRRRAAYRRPG